MNLTEIVCPGCGTKLPPGVDFTFCPYCGSRFQKINPERTVQSVFDKAIHLMDSQNESTGSTETADTKEYALRTISLLNSLLDRCLPASDIQPKTEDGWRAICPKVEAFTDEIQLDEYLCTGILPYGLAGLLLTEEDPARADFFWQTFLEQLATATMNRPAVESGILDVYGGIEFGEFADW